VCAITRQRKLSVLNETAQLNKPSNALHESTRFRFERVCRWVAEPLEKKGVNSLPLCESTVSRGT
tara:strand:- start:86 stop:280 length:195 start_codon:yes stop_codon:yes gene_type:complete